jgi:hypothetical protein
MPSSVQAPDNQLGESIVGTSGSVVAEFITATTIPAEPVGVAAAQV